MQQCKQNKLAFLYYFLSRLICIDILLLLAFCLISSIFLSERELYSSVEEPEPEPTRE